MTGKILLFGASLMLTTSLVAQTNQAAVQPPAHRQSVLYVRIIRVENAQNLKTLKGLDPKKPMSELVQDYLRQNGVALKSPSYAYFDEMARTLKVRASQSDMGKVETLMAKLRDKH